jgi:hypothetical protein
LLPFFRSLAIINICRTQSTRVRLRALARRLRHNDENIRLLPRGMDRDRMRKSVFFPSQHFSTLSFTVKRRKGAASAQEPEAVLQDRCADQIRRAHPCEASEGREGAPGVDDGKTLFQLCGDERRQVDHVAAGIL